MELRGYQTEVCRRVVQAMQRVRSVLVQMPTGTGKTWVLAALVKRMLEQTDVQGARVLIVAHRRQLVKQIEETLLRMEELEGGPEGLFCQRVRVCSIQWLTVNLERGKGEPALVVIDEAHHALAATYRALWRRWPKARFLGLTATPFRMNGEGFTELFDRLVTAGSIRQFMAQGWLSGYVYYSIRPDSREQGVIDSLCLRGADGDYLTREMREKLDDSPTLHRLYEAYRKFADGRKGLVYAIDTGHAEHIAAYYRERGLEAEAVSYRTPPARRNELVRRLATGSLRVLVNVDLFSEGFDCPDIDFIQLARPTLSLARYLQMVGRGLRRHADKERCVIIDQVGLYRVFGLPSADRDWEAWFAGVNRRPDSKGMGTQGWFPPAVWLESEEEVVRIASVDGGQGLDETTGESGFERVKTARGTGWRDRCSGRVFGSYPQTVDFGGIQLATEDGRMFFPRMQVPWKEGQGGISRKALETQPYRGVYWQRLFISFDCPDRVYRLVEVKPNGLRVYEDVQGKVFVQEDLDHRLQECTEAEVMKGLMERCEEEMARDREAKLRKYRRKVMRPGEAWPVERMPEGACWEEVEGKLMHVTYEEAGTGKEVWVDLLTGYLHEEKPVLLQRGCVSLLRENDRVYIRNIREEAGMPYRNWEVRADQRICSVGEVLYFAQDLNGRPYRIRKRSEDFRMFVLEDRTTEGGYERRKGELMVINLPDQPLEVKVNG